MSNQVEDTAKPILIPLIRGERITLNSVMQRILATWATKTVMTAEHVHPSKVVIHQDERTWLKNELAPPVGWYVWIGSYAGLIWSELAIQQHAGKLRVPTIDNGKPAVHNQTFTIITMRRLTFVVVSSSWPRMQVAIERTGNPSPGRLVPIWPVSGREIGWPGPTVLTDAELNRMAASYLPIITVQAAHGFA